MKTQLQLAALALAFWIAAILFGSLTLLGGCARNGLGGYEIAIPYINPGK